MICLTAHVGSDSTGKELTSINRLSVGGQKEVSKERGTLLRIPVHADRDSGVMATDVPI
jgi:hypothetical protein